MLKHVTKEESQLIDLYRKIKIPYNRYHCATYIRLNAKEETGKDEKIPDALERCDAIYEGFCLACSGIKDSFKGEEYENAVDKMRESTKEEMRKAYYGI